MAPKNTPTIASRDAPENVEKQVSRRAFELYETRGREDGHDLEDWLRAEAEVAAAQ